MAFIREATSTSDDSSGTITRHAMTEVYKPPTSCSSSWTYEPSGANDVRGGLLIQNAATSDNADPSCFPSKFNNYGRKAATEAFSPGYCPIGYTSANVAVQEPVTTAVCCLSKYSYVTMVMENGKAIYAGCTSMLPLKSSTIVTVREESGSSTQVTGPITMWAQPITIELQSSDSSLFVSPTTTTSTTSSAQTTSATTITSISITSGTLDLSTASSTSIASTDAKPSSLSTEAGIGVGVGVGVGGLAILAAIGLWLLRRRKVNQNPPVAKVPFPEQTYRPPYHYSDGPQELASSTSKTNSRLFPSELDSSHDGVGKEIHELHG
ncbi:hypothetical protein AJ80_06367 [Polytolypa hystricis UAMH7299]|uniref:Mid2 domain-containing protein n=1 Tax=Polytolypa hystricis (strain UAMH7299) TaxID=1447883 RepID=A0A2B7XXG6_POLH7|nr:hypothetical protein AJ80_06367 [Polytolypa hystricis UAMH7299]